MLQLAEHIDLSSDTFPLLLILQVVLLIDFDSQHSPRRLVLCQLNRSIGALADMPPQLVV